MGQGNAEFIAAALKALAVAVALYILFCVCRQRHPNVYEPRTRKAMPVIERLSRPSPPGCCAWLVPLVTLQLEDLARNSGSDAAARIAFQCTLGLAFLLLAVLSCAVLLPIYATAGGGSSGLERLTMMNVTEGCWRYWAIAITCWPASLAVYYMLHKGLSVIASIRVQEERRICNFHHQAVVTERIPPGSRSASAVKGYFELHSPGSVLYVQPIKDMGSKHEGLLHKYVDAWRGWKRAEAVEEEKPGKRHMIKTGCLGLCGRKVAAVPHYQAKCREHRRQIQEGIDRYDSLEGWSTAVVALNSMRAVAGLLENLKPGKEWGCVPAPHPREIYWSNMCKGRTRRQQLVRFIVATLLAVVVIIFFMPTLTLAQALCNLDELSRSVAWLSWVQNLPAWLRGFLQGLLPVIVVVVLNALVIPIMEFLARFSGAERFKVLHRRVMWYVFAHMIYNCFFILVASSSLFHHFQDVRDNPSRATAMLGRAIPRVSTFFTLYVMAQALLGAPSKLAMLPKVCIGLCKLRCRVKTDFEREEALEPSFDDFKIGVYYASDLFICVLCMSYSLIAPLASLFGLLYFALHVLTSKYLLNFYWKTSFNSGGALAVSAFRGVCIGMMVGQLVVVIALAWKYSFAAILVAPLVIVSFVAAILLPRYLHGSTAVQEGPFRSLYEELEVMGACPEGSRYLQQAQAAHHWSQPSYSPDFEDPVHDRFNWVTCEGSHPPKEVGHDALPPDEEQSDGRKPDGDVSRASTLCWSEHGTPERVSRWRLLAAEPDKQMQDSSDSEPGQSEDSSPTPSFGKHASVLAPFIGCTEPEAAAEQASQPPALGGEEPGGAEPGEPPSKRLLLGPPGNARAPAPGGADWGGAKSEPPTNRRPLGLGFNARAPAPGGAEPARAVHAEPRMLKPLPNTQLPALGGTEPGNLRALGIGPETQTKAPGCAKPEIAEETPRSRWRSLAVQTEPPGAQTHGQREDPGLAAAGGQPEQPSRWRSLGAQTDVHIGCNPADPSYSELLSNGRV
uniref:CSC1/OSCA1-like 7TM region domain-containing protein n=1 Tax=Alexandrium monilatum TaxID=311494 RepID=A0A7S4Q2T9_9DINO